MTKQQELQLRRELKFKSKKYIINSYINCINAVQSNNAEILSKLKEINERADELKK